MIDFISPLTQAISGSIPWLQQNFPRLIVTAGASALIYYLMIGLLRDKRKSDPRYPSTFFSLDQLTSKRWFKGICFFFAGSLTILYAAIALDAGAFLSATERLLVSLLKHKFPAEARDQLDEIFKDFPNWLEPLSVLAIFLVLFAAKARKILVTYRDLVLTASGLYSIFDETALDTARALLKKFKNNFDALELSLKKQFSEAPLPEEFVGNKGEMRVAYQIIWLNRKSIREHGLVSSLGELCRGQGIPAAGDSSFKLDIIHLAIASIAFVVLMGIYVIVVPLFHDVIPEGVRWPNLKKSGWTDVIRYVLQFTLGFVFPLMLALNMYPVRRRAYRRSETELTAFTVVASIQCVAAFIVLELFNVLDVAIAIEVHGQRDYSFWYPRLHIAAFLYSLVPVIAFGLFLKLRDRSAGFSVVVVVVSLAVGISFGACEFLYECHLEAFDHFYWYQGLLGLSISLAFFLSGSITEQFGIQNRA